MISENELTPDQKYKMEQVLFGMKKNKRNFVKKYGMKAEALMKKRALKIAKQYTPEPTIEEMEHDRLKKLVQDVLSKPLEEKSLFTSKYDDKFNDKRKNLPDGLQKAILKKQGNLNEGVVDEIENYFEIMIQNQPEDFLVLIMDLVKNDGKNWGEWIDGIQADIVDASGGDYTGDIRGYREELEEDLDLGHEDDEPHMVKGELYKIAQNAMALYKMLEPFDKMEQEVDLPAWWQSKITKACTMLGSAKSYLEFELKEPQIDAMTDVMSQEDVIDEGKLTKKEEKIVKALKKTGDFKKDDPQMYAIAKKQAKKSKAKKLAETILQRLKDKK